MPGKTRHAEGEVHEGTIHVEAGGMATDVSEERAIESYKKIRQGSLKGGATTKGMIEFAKSQGFMGGTARGGSVPEGKTGETEVHEVENKNTDRSQE